MVLVEAVEALVVEVGAEALVLVLVEASAREVWVEWVEWVVSVMVGVEALVLVVADLVEKTRGTTRQQDQCMPTDSNFAPRNGKDLEGNTY